MIPINILIVDPEQSTREDLRERASRAFPHSAVTAFGNPLDALKYSYSNEFDVLFTDIRLSPIDGYELIKALQQRRSFLSYVISGSRDRPDNLDWMLVNGYYAKPLAPEELELLASRPELREVGGPQPAALTEIQLDAVSGGANPRPEGEDLSARSILRKLFHQ